jgi:hypothetical protein
VVGIEVLVLDVKHGIEKGAVLEQPVAALEAPAAEQVVLAVDLVASELEGGLPAIGQRALDLEQLCGIAGLVANGV